jgi:hypothetical protein
VALLDVSRVTSTLVKLLETEVPRSPVWPSAVTVTVKPDPPDQIADGASNVLGMYLYHLTEDPGTKGLPPVGPGQPPVRFTPMGLNLHYQLSAHVGETGGAGGTLQEQKLIGCAAKALHDYPMIDDTTTIAGVKILDGGLRNAGNRLRIYLQPVPFSEAVSYWTAGSTPLRLATYYEVSIVMLEPQRPASATGRVLSYGVQAFTEAMPRLEGSVSTLTFTPPGASAARELELRPAQAPVGGQVRFLGTGLVGTTTELLLGSPRFAAPVVADWTPAVRDDAITATIAATASGEDVLPGIYAASARVTRRLATPSGSPDFEQVSNVAPFVVSPTVAPLPAPAAGALTVTGGVFLHPELDQKEVEVYVGPTRLVNKPPPATGPTPALTAGQFRATAANTLDVRLPAGLPSGQALPFRVLVNGAESEPRWLTIP